MWKAQWAQLPIDFLIVSMKLDDQEMIELALFQGLVWLVGNDGMENRMETSTRCREVLCRVLSCDLGWEKRAETAEMVASHN